MYQTKERKSDHPILVDIEHLAAVLSCGTDTARRIGEDAGARIIVGRRVLYSIKKIEQYIDRMAM